MGPNQRGQGQGGWGGNQCYNPNQGNWNQGPNMGGYGGNQGGWGPYKGGYGVGNQGWWLN